MNSRSSTEMEENAVSKSIINLETILASLSEPERERFDRLFDFNTSLACVLPPQAMEGWIANAFKYLALTPEDVLRFIRSQKIVHVMNRVTGQATLFNAIRSSRPMEAKSENDVTCKIEEARSKCAFCKPLELTPENIFGRVFGAVGGAKTCANVAAYDGWHGLIIFDDHSPLRFRHDEFHPDEVADLLTTAWEWANKVHTSDSEARYFFLMWNCLWRAGASIIHGHVQMTVGRKFHYGKIERLRRDALAYRAEHDVNYFTDLVTVHNDLGLAIRWGSVTVLAHLVPTKESEIVLMADRYDNPDLPSAIWRALKLFAARDIKSYNLALYTVPLGDADLAWAGFPVLVYLVDRGDLNVSTTDIGAMELYASAVVSSDPFAIAKAMLDMDA